jgi:hypothetical protein
MRGVDAPRLAAHGGGIVHLTATPTGPYLLTVWVSPSVVRAGQTIHVSAAVEMDGEPVLDAEVLVNLTHTDPGNSIQSSAATTDQSVNKLLYEADLLVSEPGTYVVNIVVAGSEGAGESAFSIEVKPEADNNLWLIGLSIIVVISVGLFRRGRRNATSQIKHK